MSTTSLGNCGPSRTCPCSDPGCEHPEAAPASAAHRPYSSIGRRWPRTEEDIRFGGTRSWLWQNRLFKPSPLLNACLDLLARLLVNGDSLRRCRTIANLLWKSAAFVSQCKPPSTVFKGAVRSGYPIENRFSYSRCCLVDDAPRRA